MPLAFTHTGHHDLCGRCVVLWISTSSGVGHPGSFAITTGALSFTYSSSSLFFSMTSVDDPTCAPSPSLSVGPFLLDVAEIRCSRKLLFEGLTLRLGSLKARAVAGQKSTVTPPCHTQGAHTHPTCNCPFLPLTCLFRQYFYYK